MQITLKQPDINAAVRAYVISQGINLTSKDFSVKFSMGRGPDALAAEVTITPMALPDFGGDEVQTGNTAGGTVTAINKPALAVVPGSNTAIDAAAASAAAAAGAGEPQETETQVDDPVEDLAPLEAGKSLFA